ncbi:hypothetical protein M440DRAFT_264523 [Trichoderma longibrachiatum ATCC 18648]|uniref:Uncharacterized protein n=1 Tax=Trichoderma longibrachiatum ATCC 18648 TaxID=983965 RepID=A0A2T4CAE4_TRILO|nr:hypothetical protein M440DRAFT_264523 [Trichoderma longibrachiatum ATCC 18648]
MSMTLHHLGGFSSRLFRLCACLLPDPPPMLVLVWLRGRGRYLVICLVVISRYLRGLCCDGAPRSSQDYEIFDVRVVQKVLPCHDSQKRPLPVALSVMSQRYVCL